MQEVSVASASRAVRFLLPALVVVITECGIQQNAPLVSRTSTTGGAAIAGTTLSSGTTGSSTSASSSGSAGQMTSTTTTTTTGGQTSTGGGTTGGSTTGGALGSSTSTGTTTGSSTTTSGGTTGSSIGTSTGTSGTTGTLISAGPDETLGSLSLAAAGAEAELFYAVANDGGYRFVLQHLAPGGATVGVPVKVAANTAALESPPLVSVASDGTHIDCCFDDFGPPALPESPSCPAAKGDSSLVRCTSVGTGATRVDPRVDGGYTDCGNQPTVTFGLGMAVVVYPVPTTSEVGLARLYSVLWPWAIYAGDGSSPLAVATVDGGVDILLMSDAGLSYYNMYSCDGVGLCGDYTTRDIADSSAPGVFSVAGANGLLGLVIQRSDVTALVVDTDAGTSLSTTLSAAGDEPVGPVAAATCASGFGYAYALDGGDVRFCETGFDGTIAAGGSTLIANLGVNARALALAATDGGLLLAVGTPAKIGVYFVGCP